MRLPLAFNAAAAVLAVALCGIYLQAADWDGALVCAVLVGALLQAMGLQGAAMPTRRLMSRRSALWVRAGVSFAVGVVVVQVALAVAS